ncbi:hypothetical protein OSCI_2800003 [Kamptonema sp. PCC 6506]|nr:hypothetical protein OSCI_2800003 [Kamptonema sp. PCC 6506]
MFSEVSLKEDMAEYNLLKGTPAIIVDYCPERRDRKMATF